jgi:adenylate cyclase
MLYLGYVSVQQRLLLPVFTPMVFAWVYYAVAALSEYLQERRARQRSVDMFCRFLDPRVVKDLVSEGEQALHDYVNAGERELSVLFSDIRGFTTLSESRSAEEIVSLLNRYFSRQTHVIFAHSGTVDKFIGDAIMAFWGAPIANKTHACDAVAAALDMVDALLDFREELGGDIGQSFNIGIGIHSGPAVVGLIGADNRLDYTCIGDTVNLASRIEGKTKDIGVRVLVSGATREQCGDMFDFIAHGSYKVKGREQEVLLFEPRRHGS